jgi:gamma-glutamylcyclotransferase (GGCT)/AIG2-like uncharacterized protein YtfP
MKFFVYGSLMQGYGNHRRIKDANLLGKFTTSKAYTMYSLGSFPAVVCGGDTAIHGEVYETEDQSIIHGLYALEGYSGIPTEDGGHNMYDIETIDTQWGKATMFVMRRKFSHHPILTGKWLQ